LEGIYHLSLISFNLKPCLKLYYSVQIAYKDIAKELLPMNLYSTPAEYRQALEVYLEHNAQNFISTIGRNSWISLFTEKLLPEVCHRFSQSLPIRFILMLCNHFR